MIYELNRASYGRILPLFRGEKQCIPACAVAEGNFPGRIFTDNPEEPRNAIVWALSRWAYIEGDASDEEFLSSLADLIRRTIFPGSLEMQMNWFELYAPSAPVWEVALGRALASLNPAPHLESTYLHHRDLYRSRRRELPVPSEMTLETCDLPIVPARATASRFISEHLASRKALGCRLLHRDRVVAVCRSNGFELGGEFMIDVDTFSTEDRQRGYATLVGTGLIDAALERDMTPVWETTEDNTPSQRLADRLGFVKQVTYPVYAMDIPTGARR